jgi:hypothetical protein
MHLGCGLTRPRHLRRPLPSTQSTPASQALYSSSKQEDRVWAVYRRVARKAGRMTNHRIAACPASADAISILKPALGAPLRFLATSPGTKPRTYGRRCSIWLRCSGRMRWCPQRRRSAAWSAAWASAARWVRWAVQAGCRHARRQGCAAGGSLLSARSVIVMSAGSRDRSG